MLDGYAGRFDQGFQLGELGFRRVTPLEPRGSLQPVDNGI